MSRPDLNDTLKAEGPDAVRKRLDNAKPYKRKANGKTETTWRDYVILARDLCDKKFPDIRYVIPGLLPEGVTWSADRSSARVGYCSKSRHRWPWARSPWYRSRQPRATCCI